MTLAQIALLMSRSRSSVGARSCALSQIQTPPFAVNVARELAELKKTGRLPENFHSLSKKHRQWASKEKSQVLAMANAGFSTRDIAASLNRSIRAVQLCARNARRADPAKLRCRARLPWTEEEASKLLDMKASGSTAKQIAHALSRSASSVDSKLYHMTRREAHPPKMKEEVRSD
jgi:DNA-binding NarL/FixJ family response regulator